MIFRFADPVVLVMLTLIPVVYFGRRKYRTPVAKIRYSNVSLWRNIPGAVSRKPLQIPMWLRYAGMVFLILAAARPQSGDYKEVINSRGVDIAIALDISGSMRALDFQPSNRLEVAKQVIGDFITKRKTDRIGLVLFGSESFTLCPLTLDHDLLKDFLSEARIGMVEEKTAVGKAIATSVNRLRIASKDSKMPAGERAKSQIAILVTDGVNTVKSQMDPITAAKAAEAMGIKIYSIGVGSHGLVDFPHPNFPGMMVKTQVELDEDTLKEVARITGGQYFLASNTEGLKTIFDTIDKIEKVEIDSFKYTRYHELYQYPLVLSLLFFAMEFLFRYSKLRRFP